MLMHCERGRCKEVTFCITEVYGKVWLCNGLLGDAKPIIMWNLY